MITPLMPRRKEVRRLLFVALLLSIYGVLSSDAGAPAAEPAEIVRRVIVSPAGVPAPSLTVSTGRQQGRPAGQLTPGGRIAAILLNASDIALLDWRKQATPIVLSPFPDSPVENFGFADGGSFLYAQAGTKVAFYRVRDDQQRLLSTPALLAPPVPLREQGFTHIAADPSSATVQIAQWTRRGQTLSEILYQVDLKTNSVATSERQRNGSKYFSLFRLHCGKRGELFGLYSSRPNERGHSMLRVECLNFPSVQPLEFRSSNSVTAVFSTHFPAAFVRAATPSVMEIFIRDPAIEEGWRREVARPELASGGVFSHLCFSHDASRLATGTERRLGMDVGMVVLNVFDFDLDHHQAFEFEESTVSVTPLGFASDGDFVVVHALREKGASTVNELQLIDARH